VKENLALVHPPPDKSFELQQAMLPTGLKFGRITPKGPRKKKSAAELRPDFPRKDRKWQKFETVSLLFFTLSNALL
jgi:hypothetical protein